MLTYCSRGKLQHISSDNICFKSRWGWKTPAASHNKGRGTWAIWNLKKVEKSLTEGEKWFFWDFCSAIHNYFHYSSLEYQKVFHDFLPSFGFAPREGLQATDNIGRAGPKVWREVARSSSEALHIFTLLFVSRSLAYFSSTGLSNLVFLGSSSGPCIFSGCEILHILTPPGFSILVSFGIFFFCIFSLLLDFLSWSLLGFSPTGKAETFLCNHALFIHLVIKKRPN